MAGGYAQTARGRTMQKTAIEYLDYSYNPIAMRCTPAGEGCKNCWHLAMARRLAANPSLSDEVRAAYAGGPPVLREGKLNAPLRPQRPSTIGVQFMGDLWHRDVPVEFIDRVFGVMARARRQQFILLTKRAQRMMEYVTGLQTVEGATRFSEQNKGAPNRVHGYAVQFRRGEPLNNVIIGVSVSNQADADELIPILLRTPAAKRIVSYEPALGPVDFGSYLSPYHCPSCAAQLGQCVCPVCGAEGYERNRLDWVIAGCESGPRRRPAETDWFRAVARQCQDSDTPFFLKQAEVDGQIVHIPELDGVIYDQLPEVTYG